MERLDMNDKYSDLEASIHLNRYNFVKPFCSNKKILDIACGEGYGSYIMLENGAKSVTGIDSSKDTIEKAKSIFNSKNLDFLCQDATDLSNIKDNTYDLIVSFETIEHLKNSTAFLQEIKRVAKENAIIIITCPNDHIYYDLDQCNPYHIKKYTYEDFKKITEKILGKNVKYMAGISCQGFCNIELKEYKKMITQSNMISGKKEISAMIIPSNVIYNYNECNYYLAIWNLETVMENAVIFANDNSEIKRIYKEAVFLSNELKEQNSNLVNYTQKYFAVNSELLYSRQEMYQLKMQNDYLNKQLWYERNRIKNKLIIFTKKILRRK